MIDNATARRDHGESFQKNIVKHSTAARRSLLQFMRDEGMIHVTFLSMLMLSGYLVVVQLPDGRPNWLETPSFTVSTAGFFFAAVFYIRWNDFWLRKRADRASKLQQLALDIDRAGYIAEMLQECKDAEGVEMPEVLLERLTTRLFMDPTTTPGISHPAADVTGALLKASSRVRVNIPGIGELTLSGRDIRRARKKAEGG